MRSLIFAAVLTFMAGFSSPARAAAVCFTDVRSWEAVKSQLPAFMQSGEFYATHQDSMLIGAFEVVQVGAVFHLKGDGRHVLAGTFHDQDDVSQACFDGASIKVTLAHGGGETITQVDGGLKIRGYKFAFTDRASYEAVVAKIPAFTPFDVPSDRFLESIAQ